MKTKLIVGLGNPGAQYARTRHNVGFMVLDEYAKRQDLKFQASQKFQSETVQIPNLPAGRQGFHPPAGGPIPILLAKPTTMMNLSGDAVRSLASFYKLEVEDILVIHDEIDLEFGRIQLKKGGGSAGHNGLKSIIEVLGEDFWRIRIGISNELRSVADASDFVLNRFSPEESEQLPEVINEACEKLEQFLNDTTA